MKTKHHSILSARAGQTAGKPPNETSRRKLFPLALCGFVYLSVCTLSPTPVEAQCKQWDVSGQWTIQQGSYLIAVALSQNGNTISGTAKQTWVADHQVRVLPGQVTGTVKGDSFDVQINWTGGAGVYRGTIRQDGTIFGTTYDKNKPSSTATWGSSDFMKCADAAPVSPGRVIGRTGKAPVPVPPGRVIGRTGKAPPANPPVVATDVNDPNASRPSGAPRITASPANGTGGSTTLTWDGGSEHPYAEVWVGVDGGDPTFVVEQGKGSRRVTVEPGKTYRYILTDSGKDLSTVTVRGK